MLYARRKATGVKHEQTWRASATGWGGQRNTARDAGRTVRVLPQAYRRYMGMVLCRQYPNAACGRTASITTAGSGWTGVYWNEMWFSGAKWKCNESKDADVCALKKKERFVKGIFIKPYGSEVREQWNKRNGAELSEHKWRALLDTSSCPNAGMRKCKNCDKLRCTQRADRKSVV